MAPDRPVGLDHRRSDIACYRSLRRVSATVLPRKIISLTEVVHEGLFLEQAFTALFSKADIVGSHGLVNYQYSRVVTVLQTAGLGLPDDSASSTIARGQLKLL